MQTGRAASDRRGFIASLAGLVGLGLCGCDTREGAEGAGEGGGPGGYPNRAITLICPWAAGGGTDRISRVVADHLQKRLGKPVVVVNRTGGSGATGHLAGATAPPDGYTLTMATFELSTMHWMGISKLTHKDFTPVLQLNGDAAALIARKDAPWKTAADFVEHVRKNPGAVRMSGTSTGGAWDLARAGFLLAAGLPVNSVVWVPTQGSAPSLVQLLGGHVDAVCCSVPEAAPQIEGGELRVLGVMAGNRLEEFPDLPTVKEGGIDWEAVGWRGIVLPKGADPALVGFLREHLRAIVESQEFRDFMKQNGFALAAREAGDFGEFLAQQEAQWEKVIREAGYARP